MIQPTSTSPRTRAAFTIVELLIALVIITLVAVVAITVFFKQPAVTLESAMELLVEDMLTAKNRALVSRRKVTVTFYAEGNGYEARYPSGEFLPSPSGRGDFIRDYTFDGVFEGVSFSDVQFGKDRALTFDNSGLTLEDGQVTLSFEGTTRSMEMTRAGGVRVLPPPHTEDAPAGN